MPPRADAERLRALRAAVGWSQRELAEELKVAPSAVAQWETGAHAVPGPAMRLIEMLEDELVGARPSPAPDGRVPRALTSIGALLWVFWDRLLDDAGESAIVRRARRSAVRRLVREFGKSKGPLLKIGQFLSTTRYGSEQEQRELLALLDGAPRPMRRSVVTDTVLSELGGSPLEVFAEFDWKPIAVASVGQVHAARTKEGTDVVVKVQHSEVERVVEADLANFELLLRYATAIVPAFRDGVYVRELRARLLEECDYRVEAAHLQRFARMFEHRADVRVPSVIAALSSKRVLTMTRERGAVWESFVQGASSAAKARAARALWQFYFESIVLHGVHHADSHLRNFLFDEDGAIAVLDFGRVSVFRPSYHAAFVRLLRAVLERDRDAVRTAMIEMEIVGDTAAYDFDLAFRQLLASHRAWLTDGSFTFSAHYVDEAWRQYAAQGRNRAHVRYAPELVFLPQIYGVTMHLAQLGQPVPCRALMLDWLYPDGRERPPPYHEEELRLLGVPS